MNRLDRIDTLAVQPEMFGQQPAAAPSVQVDTRLATPEAVQFDFDAFYELARKADLIEDHINNYRIIYTAGKICMAAGRYYPRQHTSVISIPGCREVENRAAELGPEDFRAERLKFVGLDVESKTDLASIINGSTIHETGHYVDDVLGNLRRNQHIRHLPKYGMLACLAVPVVEAVGDIANPLVAAGTAAAAVTFGTLGVIQGRRPLIRDRVEGPAYRFEYEHAAARLVNFNPNA